MAQKGVIEKKLIDLRNFFFEKIMISLGVNSLIVMKYIETLIKSFTLPKLMSQKLGRKGFFSN